MLRLQHIPPNSLCPRSRRLVISPPPPTASSPLSLSLSLSSHHYTVSFRVPNRNQFSIAAGAPAPSKRKKKERMRWERKRSPILSFSRVFPVSWFSRLKQTSGKAPPSLPEKTKQKTKCKSPSNSSLPVCFRPSRLSESGSHICSFSNLSFSPEILDGRTDQKVTGFVEPEEDYWRFSFRKRSFELKEGGLRTEAESSEYRTVGSVVADVRDRRASSTDLDFLPGMRTSVWEKKSKDSTIGESSRMDQRLLEEQYIQAAKTKFDSSTLPGKSDTNEDRHDLPAIASPACSPKSQEKPDFKKELHQFPPLNLKRPEHCRRPKPKTKTTQGNQECHQQTKYKGDSQRRKPKQRTLSTKGELFSPRTICRIRALEELKKRKKESEHEAEKEGRDFESFAVVKSSMDPQKDFRDSMVEMIAEKEIGRPEELESLLACYLSLNPSEFHNVIVKVFRQVWFDLNRDNFVSELERGYYDY